ncbi:MAG TPA: ribosome biogenesis GTPase YlqF [Candidatus Onthocola gallistercoris]|mgnify:CR=1 FL=1|uniref:Ribosome biogenesis GTPase A n=1 Tax=Candidatus Onthocola gallistercoris TaxID=2840876 RepID=A0A9D1HGL8_9FIRM|nr:ribosome biogenesis GTPase YlqF [Candidatus Onthocola gallistercoris]
MNIQWYPGHMTKARRMMQEDMKLIDIVIELVDARVPASSKNPDIDTLAAGKARMILLNKYDLADQARTEEWEKWYADKGFFVFKLDARKSGQMKAIVAMIQEACKAKIERDKRRGIINRPVRAMVVGIPNVGKSTFINSFAGKACAKTGNRPGVTKGKQWIRLNKNVELLDTPGILWPKFEDQQVGKRLAMIGSIRDDLLDLSELAVDFIGFMTKFYPGILSGRYDVDEKCDKIELLEQIARVRGCLLKGGMLDTEKASKLLLEDFRSSKLGRITLEFPER